MMQSREEIMGLVDRSNDVLQLTMLEVLLDIRDLLNGKNKGNNRASTIKEHLECTDIIAKGLWK